MHPHYLADVQIVISSLKQNTIALIHSMHGNHVIQSCLTNFSCTANAFVHETILDFFVHVANNRYGCCVLQCCLKTGNYDQYQAILTKLTENTLTLVKDAYGNYAVQFILDRGDAGMYLRMFQQMAGHIEQLSMQKFSSNVIEKGLRCDHEYSDCAELIIQELASTDRIKALLHSPYGNYVIQKALTVPHKVTVDLAAAIRPHLPALRSIPYGKKLEKLVRQAYVSNGQGDLWEEDDLVAGTSGIPSGLEGPMGYGLGVSQPWIPPLYEPSSQAAIASLISLPPPPGISNHPSVGAVGAATGLPIGGVGGLALPSLQTVLRPLGPQMIPLHALPPHSAPPVSAGIVLNLGVEPVPPPIPPPASLGMLSSSLVMPGMLPGMLEEVIPKHLEEVVVATVLAGLDEE